MVLPGWGAGERTSRVLKAMMREGGRLRRSRRRSQESLEVALVLLLPKGGPWWLL